jgi:putative Mg2+ transporter-C (MgtC) family protein
MDFYLHPTLAQAFLRMGLALVLGAVIGLDREFLNKPAGLRTFMLVGIGAAGFTLAGVLLTYESKAVVTPQRLLQLDPGRIIQGIAGGIGFLGAGTIIQSRGTVHGVTTAACVWVTGAIGVMCGFGLYAVAVLLTVMTFAVLTLVGYAERIFEPKKEDGGGESQK